MSVGVVMSVLLTVSVSSAATISLAPSKGELVVGCPTQVNVMLDTKGQQTTAMDLVLVADKNQIDFNDFNGQGGIFRSHSIPRIMEGETENLQEMYILATTATRHGAIGEGSIGTVTITPKEGTKNVSLMVKMIPNTDTNDSNVAVMSGDSVYDALDTVVNAEFTVVEGSCGTATKMEALTVDNTPKATVMVDNTKFVSKFDKQEKRDRMMQWMVINSKMLAIVGIVVLLIIIGGVVLFVRRKKTA